MKHIASPEPDIRPVLQRKRSRGLWCQASEDRATGAVLVSLEFCGTDHAGLEAAARILKRLSLRMQMGISKG